MKVSFELTEYQILAAVITAVITFIVFGIYYFTIGRKWKHREKPRVILGIGTIWLFTTLCTIIAEYGPVESRLLDLGLYSVGAIVSLGFGVTESEIKKERKRKAQLEKLVDGSAD